jgi:hypothetical protein
MRGAIPPLPQYASWRGAQLKNTREALPVLYIGLAMYILLASFISFASVVLLLILQMSGIRPSEATL